MIVFIEQGCGIMLTMNVDQLNAKLAQNGNRYQTAVYTAYILAIQMDLALDHRFGIIFHAIFGKPGQLRNIGKNRADRCLAGAGTDHIPISTLTEDGRNGINDDGFTGTGFTCQHIKSAVKRDIRTLNNSNILNMQQTKHRISLLFRISSKDS